MRNIYYCILLNPIRNFIFLNKSIIEELIIFFTGIFKVFEFIFFRLISGLIHFIIKNQFILKCKKK